MSKGSSALENKYQNIWYTMIGEKEKRKKKSGT